MKCLSVLAVDAYQYLILNAFVVEMCIHPILHGYMTNAFYKGEGGEMPLLSNSFT